MIHILQSSAFGGQIRSPKKTGINPIFRAKITVDGVSLRCYVKPMPDFYLEQDGSSFLNREITSESLGYVLAKASGLATADAAGVIVLEREMIPADALKKLDAITHGGPQDSFLAWFSQDMTYPNLVEKFVDAPWNAFQQKRIKQLAEKMAKHVDAPMVVSFDEWTLNSDRHFGNLLISPKGRLYFIDHGRIFRYPSWDPVTLGPLSSVCENRFRSIIDHYVPRWSTQLPLKSARALAYNTLSVSFKNQGIAAARSVLKNLLMEEQEVDMITDFLAQRLEPKMYCSFVGVVV
ncbi:hypothetical protein CS390_15265 [Pseudomonas sp. HLS-6]|uniref:hypothetical protein n=1 Tax=Pseudomonas sp. HLS-6 TaxID=2049589 RepID=UPI000C181F82|nr:hypothetical protein [Pseudomonas sp. HLS-6]ATR83802.1 hypothetical protein CS390_15265 [Pseudomonas sp. HLS-6]